MDSEATTEPVAVDHDHAWKKISLDEPGSPLALGTYRCDLCEEIWLM